LVADLIVFEILVVFEADEVALFGWEFCEEELEGSDGFEFAECEVGFRGVGRGVVGGFERGFALVVAEVVEGEVADGSEEPGSWVDDFLPVGVEADEGFLDEVFGGFALADEAVGEFEEWGFLGFEDCPECGFFLHGWVKRKDL
jgi:hypothetical protein